MHRFGHRERDRQRGGRREGPACAEGESDPRRVQMKLWLDTANIDEIREINSWGVLAGVTTNPTLAGKEGVPFEQRLKEIAAEVEGPVCGEVISTERARMVSEGLKLADIAPNVVVK